LEKEGTLLEAFILHLPRMGALFPPSYTFSRDENKAKTPRGFLFLLSMYENAFQVVNDR